MSFRLLVFDWDGTLMDSLDKIINSMQAAALDVGCELPLREEVRDIIGLGLMEAVVQLFPTLEPATQEGLAKRYRQHFLLENTTPSPLFPEAREVLQHLTGQGYLLGVATGKSRRGLNQSLVASGLQDYFQATRCADETFSKPHPEMLLQLMDELGVRPAETLMIGDTEYDMEMAGNAGAYALGVSYGVHPCDRLSRHPALGCLERLGDLPGWLESYLSRDGRRPGA